MHPGDAKGGIAMDQERKDPGEQEPVTPEGAHGEQFYAILRAYSRHTQSLLIQFIDTFHIC
jgi:hypothetical protein